MATFYKLDNKRVSYSPRKECFECIFWVEREAGPLSIIHKRKSLNIWGNWIRKLDNELCSCALTDSTIDVLLDSDDILITEALL
jgi:hypothetical protein